MKLPSFAMVAAFAGGILLGLAKPVPPRFALYPFPALVGPSRLFFWQWLLGWHGATEDGSDGLPLHAPKNQQSNQQ